MAKSTKAEYKRRVKQVSTLLLNGASRADILQYATKTGWDVSDSMVDKYIAEANVRFKQSSAFEVDTELGKALERLQRLYMNHLEQKDYREALSVQKEINKLLGLYAPERKEITGADGKPFEVKQSGTVAHVHSVDDANDIISELEKLGVLPDGTRTAVNNTEAD